MQTILGAGGAIGQELAKALTVHTQNIRLVSRHPKKVNATDVLMTANLLDLSAVKQAVADSAVVYLTAGLPYRTSTWRKEWPTIMENTIDACLQHKTKLVFFDNIYLYDGRQLDPITEETPIDPPGKKGAVRASIVQMLWDAAEREGLQALVARCADYYGPSITSTSLLTETVLKPLSQGKTANWFVDATKKHSFTYTPDAGKATALLGNTPDAYGQTWHLPTAPHPPTGKEWIERIASELKTAPRYRTISKSLVRFMGLFVPILRESHEMLYQYDKDYVFNSDKFERRFNFTPTPYEQGINAIVQADYKK